MSLAYDFGKNFENLLLLTCGNKKRNKTKNIKMRKKFKSIVANRKNIIK